MTETTIKHNIFKYKKVLIITLSTLALQMEMYIIAY